MSFSPIEDVRKCILRCVVCLGRSPGHIRITRKFQAWLKVELMMLARDGEVPDGDIAEMFGVPIVIAEFDDPADVSWASPPMAILEHPPLTDDPKSE